MPQVPTIGAPQVSPNTNPTPFADVRPAPDAFLGNVLGQGAAQAGQTAEHVSDALQQHAVQFQQINNQVAANKQSSATSDALDAYLTNYKTQNTGLKAFENQGQAFKDIDALVAKGGQGLSLPAQLEYDQYTRRQATVLKQQLTSYSVDQRKWETNITAKNLDDQAGKTFFANYTNPEAEQQFHDTLVKNMALRTAAGLVPDNPDIVRNEIQKAMSPVYGDVIQRIYTEQGVGAAEAYFKAHSGNLTPEAVTQIDRTLRTAKKADYIDGLGQALSGQGGDVNLGGASPISRASRNNNPLNVTNLSNGTWDGQTGTDGNFAVFGSREAGLAAADRNLQAYGQQHNIDTVRGVISRWAPPNENNTADYVKTVSAATGFAPDAHIDLNDPNVRHKLIAAMEPVEGGHASPSTPMHIAPVPITDNTDPAAYKAQVLANAQAFLNGHPEIGAADRQAILASAERNVNITVQRLDAKQTASFNTLDKFAEDNHVSDVTLLQQKFPAEWNALPESKQIAISRNVGYWANLYTQERENNYLAARGKLADAKAGINPDAFTSMDFRNGNYDLTRPQRQELIKAQQDFSAHQQSYGALEKTYGDTMKSVEVQHAISALGIDPKSDEAATFRGALYGQLEAYQQRTGKLPTPGSPEMNGIISGLSAQHGGFSILGASYGATAGYADIPDASRTRIIQQFHEAGQPTPSDAEIARIYNIRQGLTNGR